MEWVVDATRECFTHAKKVGVKIAVEPLNRFETYLFAAPGPGAGRRGQPECGVCLDAYHIHMEEFNVYDAIRQVASGCTTSTSPTTASQPASQIDWPKIVATLREVGYDGALTNESSPRPQRRPRPIDMVERNPVDISPGQLSSSGPRPSVLSEILHRPDAHHR